MLAVGAEPAENFGMSLLTSNVEQSVDKLLVHCHRRVYAAKAAIIRQGDPAGELY